MQDIMVRPDGESLIRERIPGIQLVETIFENGPVDN